MQKNQQSLFTTLFLSTLIALPTALSAVDFQTAEIRQHPGEASEERILDRQLVIARPLLTSEVGKSGFIKKLVSKGLNLVATGKSEFPGFADFNLQDQVFFSENDPARQTPFQNKFQAYLEGSPELRDCLKLRRIGRAIRSSLAIDRPDIRGWLQKEYNEPVVLLEKSPLPTLAGQLGPVFIPLGAKVFDSQGAERHLVGSVINLSDISQGGKTIFSVEESMANDTLDVVVAHENAHGIMFDMYGKAMTEIRKPSQVGHDAPLITDEGLAFMEGFAEAHEAYYGLGRDDMTRRTTKIQALQEQSRKAGVKPPVSEFLLDRQDPIRLDRYVWVHHLGQKTGTLKNGLQILSCEGAVAGFFYDLWTSRTIQNAYEKTLTVFAVAKPGSYRDFLKAFLKLYPGDRQTALRLFLETTRYVTVAPGMRQVYREYYQTRVLYNQKRIEKEKYLATKRLYEDSKEKLFQRVLATGQFDEGIQGPIWFRANLKKNKQEKQGILEKLIKGITGSKQKPDQILLDLNSSPAGYLAILEGMDPRVAAKLCEERDSVGGFFVFEDLKNVLAPADFEKFMAGARPEVVDFDREGNPLATYSDFIRLDDILPKK